MEQLSFFEEIGAMPSKSEYIVDKFSAGDLCDEHARQALEKKYEPILEVTNRFDRRSVSYQLSKKDALHSWLKYKEGFSADLVGQLLDDMGAKPGDLVMDPFMGSGTTALVCQMRGINSIGFDIMPISAVAIKAKANVMLYDQDEIKRLIAEVKALKLPERYNGFTPYVTITDTAYPVFNGQFIQYSSDWIKTADFDDIVKNLFTLAVLNSLERCSYTTKSGQYLSWDCRSDKVKNANITRKEQGKKLLPEKFVRKEILNVQDTIVTELEHILSDVEMIQQQCEKGVTAEFDYREKSVLYQLAELEDDCLKGVITSPPYCNRYDYTRTYALELVYLGTTEEGIKKMRQDLLSCTVESKTKVETLRKYYSSIGQEERFQQIYDIIQSNEAFTEIKQAMDKRKDNGDLNNKGVIRMIEGYFTELAFIYAELYRLCKPGALVAFVNDNVRYGGEVIPVDFLSTSFAEQFGFKAEKVYCLKQQKGNSSQQMAKYGRVALRKSITIWKK